MLRLNLKNGVSTFISTLSWVLVFSFTQINLSQAQSTIIKGQVLDAKNNEPLISASVSFQGSTIGTNTDLDGFFEIESDEATDTLVVNYLGYQTQKKKIRIGEKQVVNFLLESGAITLNEISITVKKKKYRNKNNPAVALIRKVIDKKNENRVEGFDYYEYEKYEKVMLGLSNVSERFKKRRAFRKFKFLFENMDTTSLPGKEILPVFLKETLSDVRYRKSPKKTKEFILADTTVAFKGYVDNNGFNQYLDNLYQQVDIYENNIMILNQQFLSPVANGSPTFYKFFIQDTVKVDGVDCVELFFAPRNKLDVLFQGTLFIAYEDNYSIKKVDMSVNSNINLNWVKSLNITQNYEKINDQGYALTFDEFQADFGLTKKGMGVFGRRIVSNQEILINHPRPDEDYKGRPLEKQVENYNNTIAFWNANRHVQLNNSESFTYQKMDSLQDVRVFKRAMKIATLLLSGYSNVGPYFEIGPVNTFYSFNPVEGFRLRLGGRTTLNFSDRLEIETYGAYGFRDEKVKGYLGATYALSSGSIHQFPVSRIRLSAQREIRIPGQELQFVQEDNILLSFKRGVNDKYLYNTKYQFEYLNEFENHFSFALGYTNLNQTPTGSLIYHRENELGEIEQVNELHTSEASLMLRWAPNEQFYQGKTYRKPILNKFPIFTFRYRAGIKGLGGGEYNYHNVSLEVMKRFFLSRLGISDLRVTGGAILGEVPYPLLKIHAANQTYSYQLFGYNLMNFQEFVSDHYVSLNLDHDFNGLILNRIPLVRRLKWREAINLRVLYGGIMDENDPEKNRGLIAFPTNENGALTTFSLEEKPYIEGSIGFANIFKFFRVDLVKRFTYLENPNITEWGVRGRFKFYF